MKRSIAGRLFSLGLLVAAVSSAAQGDAELQLVDRVMAVVDGDPILASDVRQIIDLELIDRRPGEEERDLERRVLDALIDQKLRFHEIDRSGYGDILGSGIVITGGSAILEGVPELAERVFDMPVRRGNPIGIGGLIDVVSSPIYATGVGLVVYGSKQIARSAKFRKALLVLPVQRRADAVAR